MKLIWTNLSQEERHRYMQLQMSPKSYGRSDYLPDDCSVCGACGCPTLGYGWCQFCLNEYHQLRNKLEGKIVAQQEAQQ